MNSRKSIDEFLSLDSYAVVGVSRTGNKFGNKVYRLLKNRGCKVYPVNPAAEQVEGDRCYPRLQSLPQKVGGIVVVVPPKETERVVKQAAESGIRRVWMQQGSESRKAIQYCEQYGLDAVYGRCIFMFSEPVGSFHKFHRWGLRVLGKIPR